MSKFVSLAYAQALTEAWVTVWPKAERDAHIRRVAQAKEEALK